MARAIAGKPLEAYCLNPESKLFGFYQVESMSCDYQENGSSVDA